MPAVQGALTDDAQRVTAAALQGALIDLVDLALLGKQAHWNLPAGRQRDDDVVRAFVLRYAALIERMRQRIRDTERADPVTEDSLVDLTQALVKQYWMWQARARRN